MITKAALFRLFVRMVPMACLLSGVLARAQRNGLPSVFCHVTDGQFTACPEGGSEWSDVPVQSFQQTQSFVYASQTDLDPTAGSSFSPFDTFVLMYDECGRRSPLGEDEYFRVAFKTVETEDGAEKLEHYVIHIFRDGTIIFIEDDAVQPPGRAPVVDGMRGKVGFGTSPNCSFDHVVAEFQVPLSITGSSYSPDPLFWGASIPSPPPDCPQGLFERSNSLVNNTANCPPSPECPEGSIEVPVLVNVLTGVNEGVAESDESIHEMVRQANLALGKVGMCLTAALIDREVPDLGSNDGFVDLVAHNRLEDACISEMSFRFGTDIGYKIFLANHVVGADIHGVAPGLGQSGVIAPCIFLRAETPISAGSVLAHEIGHTAGLEISPPLAT